MIEQARFLLVAMRKKAFPRAAVVKRQLVAQQVAGAGLGREETITIGQADAYAKSFAIAKAG